MNEDQPAPVADDDLEAAVIAADDTGMVANEASIVQEEIESHLPPLQQ